jgi:Ca2+-binding RTX toxin-like protein
MPQTPVTDYTKVSTTVLGSQFAPAVTALTGGGYVIVWQDFNAGAVYAQRYNASGQPVGTELHLDSVQGGSPLWVSVAATPGDGFVIAYQAGGFANAEIFAHRYDSLGNPSGGTFAVNTTTPNEQYNPHVTTLDNGAILFTWDTQALDVFQEVRGRIYTSDGQALGNDFSIAPMSATVENGFSAIAPLPGGGFVVTWQSATPMGSDNFEIVGQRFNSAGATVGTQFQANIATANSQSGNDVARLSDGGFVVSWVDAPGSNGGGRIVARHYDASGVAIGGEILIDSKASGDYGRTVVTALANGGYVVGWMEADPANNNVLARAMGSNDVPIDVAFEMSFDSPFGANFFSDGAVTLANGNVVFTWDGPSVTPPGGQGTGEDVYMREYSFSSAPSNTGGPGPDTLPGGPGPDTLIGLDGNDTYFVNDPGDAVEEAAGQGYDVVFTSVDYTLPAGQSIEAMATSNFNGNTPLNLTGNELANYLIGNEGANILNGGAGADALEGRGGDDTYIVDNAADYVVEYPGQGNDAVYSPVDYTLGAGQSIELLATGNVNGSVPLNLTGNELANHLIGNEGANQLSGGAGADILEGRGGNDNYIVDDAGDQAIEAAGQGHDAVYSSVSYTLGAGQSIEALATSNFNGNAALNFTGNELSNYLIGNEGANVLNGGAGSDALDGRGGADTFVFANTLGPNNVDQIVGFNSTDDTIRLDHNMFAGLGLGTLSANAFVTGTQAGDGDDRIVYDSTTGNLFFDADGAGGNPAVLFAILVGAPALTANDFVVI